MAGTSDAEIAFVPSFVLLLETPQDDSIQCGGFRTGDWAVQTVVNGRLQHLISDSAIEKSADIVASK